MTSPAIVAKRLSRAILIVAGICGVVAIYLGIGTMRSGISELRGSGASAAVTTMLAEIETAVAAANQSGLEAAPLFQALLTSVDSVGLSSVHRDQKDVGRRVTALFGISFEQFGLAATTSDAAARVETREKQKTFLAAKAEAYRHFAESAAISKEIVALVMDESITTAEQLVSVVIDAGKRRDAALALGNAAQARASAMAKELNN